MDYIPIENKFILIMQLPLIPTLVSAFTSGVSGAVGGYCAFLIVKRIDLTAIVHAN